VKEGGDSKREVISRAKITRKKIKKKSKNRVWLLAGSDDKRLTGGELARRELEIRGGNLRDLMCKVSSGKKFKKWGGHGLESSERGAASRT